MRNWSSLVFAFVIAGCGGSSSSVNSTSTGGGNPGVGGNGAVSADGGAPADGGSTTPPTTDGGTTDGASPPLTYTWTRRALGRGFEPMIGWASSAGDVWLGSPITHSTGDDQWTDVASVPVPPAIEIDAIGGLGAGEVVLGEANIGAGANGWLERMNPADGSWVDVHDNYSIGHVSDIYGNGDDLWVTSQAGYLSHSSDHGATFSVATGASAWVFTSVRGHGSQVVATGSIPAATANDGEAAAPGQITSVSGIYYSADDGATWAVSPTPQDYYVGAVVYGGVIYLATSSDAAKILRSTDGGASFTNVTPSGAGITLASHGLVAVGPNDLWLADNNGRGLLHTTDGGQTWTDGIGGNDPLTSVWLAGNDIYAAGTVQSANTIVYHGRAQ